MASDPTMCDWLGLYARETATVLGQLSMATAESARSEMIGIRAAEEAAKRLRMIAARLDEAAAAARVRAEPSCPVPDAEDDRP